MSAPKILFVDDEEFVLKAIGRHFLDEDYEILTATSAREGLEILERNSIPVVVSDFRMPEMNGGEFLKIVCERWPETIRLVLSGYADITAVISAINEGEIYKFISKPWQKHELKEAVRDALNKYESMMNMRSLAEEALAVNTELLANKVQSEDGERRQLLEMASALDEAKLYESAFKAVTVPLLMFLRNGNLAAMNRAARTLVQCLSCEEKDQIAPVMLPDEVHQCVAEAVADSAMTTGVNKQITVCGNVWNISLNRFSESEEYHGVVMAVLGCGSGKPESNQTVPLLVPFQERLTRMSLCRAVGFWGS
jgi:two-component system NtrC family sensor kinase